MITRRRFLARVAGAAGTLGPLARAGAAMAEAPPETKRIRLTKETSICLAPLYVGEELLRAEGFTDVQYVPLEGTMGTGQMLGAGKADLGSDAAPALILNIEAGESILAVGGLHGGCYELFGTDRVRTIKDLKGKRVAVTQLRDDRHAFVAAMLAHVGLDARKDIQWVMHPVAEAIRLLQAGRVDAFMGFPPEPQELRAKKIGRVIVNTAVDRPWAQYFCCLAVANRDFVRRHPVATKRALRALLKAAELCAREPARAAALLVEKGYVDRRDVALQVLQEVPFSRWREYVPEDTVRFYSLRLREAGMIKTSPQRIIAEHTDWSMFNALKKELKA